MLDLDFFLVSMLLQKQRNLCLRLQYILYLQYNKQWYQIARQIYCQIFFLLELQLFELLIAFLIPIFLILYFVSFSVFELNCRIKTFFWIQWIEFLKFSINKMMLQKRTNIG